MCRDGPLRRHSFMSTQVWLGPCLGVGTTVRRASSAQRYIRCRTASRYIWSAIYCPVAPSSSRLRGPELAPCDSHPTRHVDRQRVLCCIQMETYDRGLARCMSYRVRLANEAHVQLKLQISVFRTQNHIHIQLPRPAGSPLALCHRYHHHTITHNPALASYGTRAILS